ncbi:MAG: hypothetical protein ACRD3M_09015 [Thermoanaerobaculia bacterium]
MNQSTGESAETPNRPAWRRSLRLRLNGWTIAVFGLTLAAFTGAGILQERRELIRTETAQARGLLAHLADMPEFQASFESAASRLASIRELLRATGADLVLAPVDRRASGQDSARPASGVLAAREISLHEGPFELRYRSDPQRLQEATRRAAAIHILHGVLALAALTAGTEWILRRRLVAPLQKISHQVDHMRKGGGWLPILPPTDSELEGLAAAIKDLGPGLERQVHQWVVAERRAGIALALKNVRDELREPLKDIRGIASDLQARDFVTPSGKQRIRSLLASMDRVRRAFESEERLQFSREVGPDPEADHPSPGKEASS